MAQTSNTEGWVMCVICGNWTKEVWYVEHVQERHVKPAERELERARALMAQLSTGRNE